MDSAIIGFAESYLGVQEVNWDSQEEDEHEEGEQLARRVRYRESSRNASAQLTTMYAVR